MSYTVYNNNGTVLVSLPTGTIDDVTTSITFIGKNVNNYGEIYNNNLVKMLSNFANENTSPPNSPLQGQLYYNSTEKRLLVFDGEKFKPVYESSVSATSPTNASDGEFWYDSGAGQFRVYANGAWTLVGPAVSPALGKFGIEPPPSSYSFREFQSNDQKNVGVVYSYGNVSQVLTSATFTMSSGTSLVYWGTTTPVIVYSGTNFVSNVKIKENLYVDGNIELKGTILNYPNKSLTSYYDATWIGTFTGALSTTQNIALYDNHNNFVRVNVLPHLFTSTQYSLDSEVKVLFALGTSTHVRHYYLSTGTTMLERVWKAKEVYTNTNTSPFYSFFGATQTSTNIVRIDL